MKIITSPYFYIPVIIIVVILLILLYRYSNCSCVGLPCSFWTGKCKSGTTGTKRVGICSDCNDSFSKANCPNCKDEVTLPPIHANPVLGTLPGQTREQKVCREITPTGFKLVPCPEK